MWKNIVDRQAADTAWHMYMAFWVLKITNT